jgi:hypothetical protein
LQRRQVASESKEGIMEFSQAFVGRIFQAIFQIKSLSLSFNFSFQMSFHKEVEIGDIVAEKLLSKIAR